MQKVKVYWNINQAKQGNYVFSVVQNGLVIGYTADIHLANARFHVNDNARQKIADGAKKSVHAWVIGYVDESAISGLAECTYNPKRDAFFTDVNTGADLSPDKIYSHAVLKSENKRGAV